MVCRAGITVVSNDCILVSLYFGVICMSYSNLADLLFVLSVLPMFQKSAPSLLCYLAAENGVVHSDPPDSLTPSALCVSRSSCLRPFALTPVCVQST